MQSYERMKMSQKRIILGACLMLSITFLIYIPAIKGGFIWDDDGFITENPLIKAKDGLYRFWCTTEAADYFPLTSTMLWMEWRMWGLNAFGYHVVNVFLHALSCLLIWLVLIRLKVPGAWLAGLIFAVHPVNVESVAWITERKNVLAMVFYLLSILLYLRYEKDEPHWVYGLSLFSFLLGLLSKTSVIMQPFVLLGCAWWQRGRIVRRDILHVIPFFVLSGILGVVTVWFQYHQAIGSTIVRDDSFLSRLAGAGWAIWFYIYKAVFPYKLSFVYPRWEIDDTSVVSLVPVLLLIGLLTLFWWYRKIWGRPFLSGIGYFVVTLFPVLGFFNIYFMKYSLVADHWQYTSIIGIIALVVGLGNYLYGRWKEGFRRVAVLGVVVVICILSLHTWRQAHVYKDEETLWRDTIAKNPKCWMAYDLLGLALCKQGRLKEGISLYKEALKIKPDYALAHNNLANALYDIGYTKEAISHFSEALRIEPNLVTAHYNLGTALVEQGRISDAINHYLEAVRILPNYAAAHNNLGIALAYQGRIDEAIVHFREALRVNPNDVTVRRNLEYALKKKGK
jgi:tetratricopeptide (TPR) repeat protein